MTRFLPKPRAPRARVVLVAFEGVQTLDVTGPAEVFAVASREAGAPLYELVYVSPSGGTITTSSGLRVETLSLGGIAPAKGDTVLVAGGEEGALVAATKGGTLVPWIRRARRVARLGSVCSGAFLLAAAGVLDGLSVATHWSACDRLASFRPALTVDRDAIFVRNGDVWTSAGVTTGIDMALAMVEDDHDRALADRIAARLVLYARRPGFQSQFSDALVAQSEAGDPLAPAIAWARTRLGEVDVPRLARRAGLSVRTLHRRCVELLGVTPKKLVDRLRVEHARTLLRAGKGASQKVVARRSGFGSVAGMRRAFQEVLGLSPREVELLFAPPAVVRSPSRAVSEKRAGARAAT